MYFECGVYFNAKNDFAVVFGHVLHSMVYCLIACIEMLTTAVTTSFYILLLLDVEYCAQ